MLFFCFCLMCNKPQSVIRSKKPAASYVGNKLLPRVRTDLLARTCKFCRKSVRKL